MWDDGRSELLEQNERLWTALKAVEWDATGRCNCCAGKDRHEEGCLVGDVLRGGKLMDDIQEVFRENAMVRDILESWSYNSRPATTPQGRATAWPRRQQPNEERAWGRTKVKSLNHEGGIYMLRLTLERKKRGMTITDLAFEVKIHPSTLGKLEGQKMIAYKPHKEKLEAFFHLSSDELFREVEEHANTGY